MERGFGQSFADVRVHDDSAAAGASARLGALAFTVGTDVTFAAGRFRPGTLAGKALIAHELAHVVQQRGMPASIQHAGRSDAGVLDRNASEGAIAALTGRPWTPERAGLRLQRCNGGGEHETRDDRGGTVEAPPSDAGRAADAISPPAQGSQPTVQAPSQDVQVIDLSTLQWQPNNSADAVLMLRGANQSLYLLPARGLVYTPVPTEAAGAQGTPNLASIGIPAAGHAGVYLVRTSRGTGMLVDAGGTARGAPNVLLPGSLAWIRARMGVTQIVGALISHTHADHVANLESLVQQGLVTGSRAWAYPGWESTTQRTPLARAFQALRNARYAAQGFGPTWSPSRLQTQGLAGVTTATLLLGDARVEVFTRTADLQRYNQELAAGRTGSRFADAASMLTRIRPGGASWDFTILGDIRGSTIADLHDQMGATAFETLFRDTRVLGGFQHHLGAVNSARDVRGMTLLLRAARSADFPLTIVVQTDAGRNATLISQLQEAGARVLVLGEVDPSNPAGVRVRASGDVEARGAQIFEPSSIVQEARSRIENLTRAAEVLETHAGLVHVSGTTHAELARELRAEAQRLRDVVYERQSLSIAETHPSTQRADHATRLAANSTALQTPRGAAATLGQESIHMLRRLNERADDMQREIAAARAAGRASERLRRLVMEVEPAFARAVLADEYGRATNQRGLLRAQRRAEYRLRQQVDLQRALTSGGGARITAGPRRVAVGLIALEIFNIVAPLIQYGVDQYRDRRARDFYVFLTVGGWWHDKGAAVPVRGRRGGADVPGTEDITPSAIKRMWQDAPERSRVAEGNLSEAVRAAQPLEALWIPPLADWTNAQAVWDTFRLWVSIHVNSFDDYAAEFLDIPSPAIRQHGSFESGTWEVRTGRIDDDGHVAEGWEQSAELTTIMRATAGAVIAGTERRIADEWAARREPIQQSPSISPAGSPSPRSARPTAKARFSGSRRDVFSAWQNPPGTGTDQWDIRQLRNFRFWTSDPTFLIYGEVPAPNGHVWVAGADYNTAAALRANDAWSDDYDAIVHIPKWYTPLYEAMPREPEYTPRERAALDAVQANRAIYFGYEVVRPSQPYRGEVHFAYLGPNVGGRVLVRRRDLAEPFER